MCRLTTPTRSMTTSCERIGQMFRLLIVRFPLHLRGWRVRGECECVTARSFGWASNQNDVCFFSRTFWSSSLFLAFVYLIGKKMAAQLSLLLQATGIGQVATHAVQKGRYQLTSLLDATKVLCNTAGSPSSTQITQH
jgi:hypothetical protein